MSSDRSVNESPNHFMVLDAIARGMKKIDSISKVTKLSKDEVELIVNDLVMQKILIKNVKKGFFGNKKIEFHIAETGMKILNSKKQELTEKSQRLQQLYETGDKSQVQSFMDSNRMWIPMMLFSGIMNMMFFASMMSFMGMAMNPSESAMTEGQEINLVLELPTIQEQQLIVVVILEQVRWIQAVEILEGLMQEALVTFKKSLKKNHSI